MSRFSADVRDEVIRLHPTVCETARPEHLGFVDGNSSGCRGHVVGNWCHWRIHQLSHQGDPGSIPGPGRCPGEGIHNPLQYSWASLGAQMVKESNICNAKDLGSIPELGRSPGRVVKNPPAKARAVRYAGILAWRIPRTEEPGGLQPMGSQRVGHN